LSTGPTIRSVRTDQLAEGDPTEAQACRQCGVTRTGDERFCESCGHDHEACASWSVEVGADQDYHARAGSGMPLPMNRIASVLVFETDEITVGRRSESRKIYPQVDLSGELADPAASHAHARITRDAASAAFTIVDLGSTNGTTINDDDQPIEPDQPFQLRAGDRIYVGAWTVLNIRS
jgi:hypothetical protein